MFGAIIGDIIGSTYEFRRMKDWDFELFPRGSEFTDDSILTIAIADALMDWIRDGVDLKKSFVDVMLAYVNAYPYPLGGYGASFFDWAEVKNIYRITAAETDRPCVFHRARWLPDHLTRR